VVRVAQDEADALDSRAGVYLNSVAGAMRQRFFTGAPPTALEVLRDEMAAEDPGSWIIPRLDGMIAVEREGGDPGAVGL
jgi:hypothetical protein